MRAPRTVRMVAASEPPADAKIWGAWAKRGFEVVALPRIRLVGGGSHERGVDEQLHAAGLQLATQFEDSHWPPGAAAIVLATGDGNANGSRSDFPSMVWAAARRGMRVEVWSWRHTTSRHFIDIKQARPPRGHGKAWRRLQRKQRGRRGRAL